jgi:hypothetical protein
MPETQLLFLAGAAVVIVLLVAPYPRRSMRRPANTRTDALKKLRSSGLYWGITIHNGKCAAIRQYLGRPYKLDESPALPLSGCKAGRCTCTYAGLRERRKHQRRQIRDRRDAIRFDSRHPDRRNKRERRRGFNRWRDNGE